MANKIVTKKLTTTTGTALCFDMIAEKAKELHFDFEGKLSERQMIKKFAENYGGENLNLLKLKNIENGQRIYAMDLDKFISNAYILDNNEENTEE